VTPGAATGGDCAAAGAARTALSARHGMTIARGFTRKTVPARGAKAEG
jgi:hypothetical protein